MPNAAVPGTKEEGRREIRNVRRAHPDYERYQHYCGGPNDHGPAVLVDVEDGTCERCRNEAVR